MEFRVLGPFDVQAGGAARAVGGPKPRAVLATLVLRANEVVSTDALVDVLWGDGTVPASAVGIVRTYVCRLRRALAGAGAGPEVCLVGRPPGYVLETDPDRVDAHRFEALVGRGRRAAAQDRPDVAASALRQALDLWRGEALADLTGIEAIRPAVSRLGQLRLTAVEERVDAELALGRHAEVVAELEALSRAHPFRERLWGQLVVALYRCGRQTEALGAYRTVRAALVDQMGLEPGPGLRALERQVLCQDQDLVWCPPTGPAGLRHGHRAAAGTPDRRPAPAWPVPLTPLIGRERAVAELRARLDDDRLVTVVGAPGCGKSRVAVEAVAPVASAGATYLDLALVDGPGLAGTLARTLAAGDPGVVVLDNAEHVAGALAPLVERLLAGCPARSLVVTSRVALGVAGERVWELPPLDVPAAVRLFVERANLVSRCFRLDAAGAQTVAAICRRLDGLPLAVEQAAAWTRVLSPAQIADRLAGDGALLTAGFEGAGLRSAPMAAAVEASYRLVPAEARDLLAALAAADGGLDLDAVTALGPPAGDARGDVLAGLGVLVNHSLVVADHTGSPSPRYRLLEPVRQCMRGLTEQSVTR